MATKSRRCVLYARISRSTDESVSVQRQIEAGEKYADLRGWRVVGRYIDEGTSATHHRPEDRNGWQQILTCRDDYDAVIVWKVDRLARRVIDFLHANEAIKARGAGIVAVEDPIDMTTAQGEAFATMLAVFGQMEADAIRARVRAARDHLLRNGRYAGGAVLYGYKAIPNPEGAGWVVTQDEDRIGYVKTMVQRTIAGHSIYSTTRWLDAAGAPTSTGVDKWSYNTVERILRHPMLAGMTPHNPGHVSELRRRGEEVVRDADGLPDVDESLAIMPVGQWRAMLARLDDPGTDARRAPRAMRRKTSGLLSGLVVCGMHDDDPVRMWRGTTQGRPSYSCPTCHQTFSTFEELVVEQFLDRCGDLMHLSFVQELAEGGSVELQATTIRLAELGREIVIADPERTVQIVAEMTRLKERQESAKDQPAEVVYRPVGGETRTFAEDWADAPDDEARRVILGHAIDRIWVRRGTQGAWTKAHKLARMTIEWRPMGDTEAPDDGWFAAAAGDEPWKGQTATA